MAPGLAARRDLGDKGPGGHDLLQDPGVARRVEAVDAPGGHRQGPAALLGAAVGGGVDAVGAPRHDEDAAGGELAPQVPGDALPVGGRGPRADQGDRQAGAGSGGCGGPGVHAWLGADGICLMSFSKAQPSKTMATRRNSGSAKLYTGSVVSSRETTVSSLGKQ